MKDLYAEFAAGKTVFREGDVGAEMYIVERGSVEITRAARGNEPVALLEVGDFFGEMAILEDLPRYASAVAKTDCRLLRIERASFADLLAQNVEIAVRIMRKLAARQRDAEQMTAQLRAELDRLKSQAESVAAVAAPAKAERAPKSADAVVKPEAIPKPEGSAVEKVSAPAPKAAAKPISAPAPAPPASVAAPAPMPAPAPLVAPPAPVIAGVVCVLLHAGSGQRFALDRSSSEFLIGRTDPVTGITPEINLGALDTTRSLSRRHAKLLAEGGVYFLREEVGTANGTYVNGQRLATGATVPLKAGDKLRFGSIDMELATA